MDMGQYHKRRTMLLKGLGAVGTLTFLNTARSFAQGIGWDVPSAQHVIRLCYLQVLERRADDQGMANYTYKLVRQNMSTQELVYDLGTSNEYKARFIIPWTPSQNWHPIVVKMYNHFLDRSPENEQVVVSHSGPLHEGDYEGLVHTFVYGNEYKRRWGALGVPRYGLQAVNSGTPGTTFVKGDLFYFKLVKADSSLPCITDGVFAESQDAAKSRAEADWPGYTATPINVAQYADYSTCSG